MTKKRDIPPVPVSGSADTSAIRRSGRETLANKQVAPTPANTKKSTGFENQTAPVATFVKKRPENNEKQMGPSPLRRSERGKNLDDGPATNVQSTEDVNKDGNTETQDPPEVSGRKRKRFNAIRFKARFKPQRVRVESDDEEDSEREGGASTSEVKTISNADGDKEVEDRDKGVGKYSDVADGQSVHGSPDRAQKAVLEVGLIASDQEEHVGCLSQTKPVEGESVESGNVEKQIGGNCSPSNGHIADTSLSRINHVLENQQELDFRDKDTGTSKPAGVMENAENNNANTNIQNAGSIVNSSKFVEYWVPVQLSNVQLEQYCASLLSNATVFQSCSRSATDDALLEILNSNRKCCNHPYLVDANLQGKITMGLHLQPTRILDVDIKVSGKLQFLDLVLPEVKKRQLRALILYQPTSGSASVGPVLGEFVHQRFGQDSYECLDGVGIVSSKKQTALSNFNNEKNRFIFLLASNACNSTVKLSSIDIVIIFDSDLNPSTDIKSLQKITIDSQSEQTMVVRLYTSLTLEEKILKLADHDNMIQNLRSKYNALLMWGASDLFNRLEEFHNQSDNNISSEESILNNVVKEFLHIISHKSESDDTTKSFITRVESCGSYGKNNMFQSEMKTLLPDGDHPRVFWKKLLEGKNPVWRFRSESTPRQRKRPNFFSDSCGVNTRRKTVKNVVDGETGRSNEGVPVQNESPLSSGDHFWSTAVGNEENVHDLLKPTVSELCKILKFSENVTTIVESFLKFVIENFQVFKKHTSVLQALMISVCWIGSSLSKYMIDMIDREQSFALAKKHLNFICSKEEADQVYEKLQSVKETFLQNTKDLEIVNNIEECTMPHQEPRMSNSVPLNPQESIPENRDSSNEETLQSTKQILKEDLARKDENEIDKFNRVWDEKRKQIENERELGKALFRCLYPSKSSKRSEMLKSEEEKFTNKLKEHERLRVIHLSDLKAKLNAPVGQVVVNDERSLHGSAHETQIVDLVRSEKSDQGSPEVAPVLSGNPSEAQIHDKPLNEMCPVVVPAEVIVISDDSSDGESIGSHSSEKQTADAMVKTEPIMENDVTVDNATLLSEPIGDIAAIEEIVSSIPIEENASELHDEVENDVVGADATVISEPIGEISAKQNADMENDKAGQAECVEMEVLAVDTNKENPKACIVEGCNETGHDDLVSHVDSVETLAVNNMSENVESADGSHAAEDTVRTSHDAVTPNAESADMGIPTASGMSNGTDLEPNLESTDGSHAVEDPVGTSPDGVAPHAESIEMGITAEKGMPTGNCTEPNLESVDGSHAVGDPNVSGPTDVAPHIESTELGIPAVECNKENADDGTVRAGALQGVEGHNLTSGSSSSSSSSSSADVVPAVLDHSVPPIHDIQSECLQVQQPPDSGIQDQEVQAMSTPIVQIEDNNLQPIDMVQVDQTIIDNSSPDPHNEPVVAVETPITEDQSAALPTSEGLAQTSSEPIVSAETPITEPIVVAETPNLMQNASQLERMFALQRNGNFNHMGLRRNTTDPLHLELQRLHSEKENMVKFHQENMQKINVDCEREIAEVTAQIRLKYGNKRQEAETAFNSQKNEVESNMHKVAWNKVLAAAFRSKCQDLIPGNAGLQQASQAGLMQQLHRFPGQSSVRRSPGQSSGTQQAPTPPQSISTAAAAPPPSISTAAPPPPPLRATSMPPPSLQRTQPPLQIVDNPSALFSNPLTRYSHNTSLRPTATTPIRPQPNANPIPNIPSTTTTSRVLTTATTTPIRPPPYANPIPSIPSTTTTSGVLTTATTTPIRPPPNTNPTPAIPSATTSTTPSAIARPPPNIFPIAPSTTTPTTTSSSIPPPAVIPITPSTTPASRLSTSVTSITLSPTTTSTPSTTVTPVTSSTTTTSIAPPTVTPITTSTTSSTIRLPHGSNHLSPSTTPIRPPFRLSSFDMSAANLRINTETRGQSQHSRPLVNGISRGAAPHMRPMVSREVRAPGPHLRPLARSDFRSPAPHMRSFASTGVRSPAPHMRPFRPTSEPSVIGTSQRTLPGQHVTSNIPSTSTSQPPVLVSSVQPLAPLPTEPLPVPPPPAARSESPQPPPPQSQLRHTSHQHPLSSLSDDLNVLMDNVARLHNSMNTPEFSAGGNAAQTSATEVVCLSDDD
ncbi:P-loop containing nucleoside triphosphate hydrolase [Artemisia annua]|uniref:P-loop containing nucleoside triphosphate hydrolase n=1 Tax=Artemisia annua TaxID=35608 RepID=A0A2U1QG12_ARTAN|nr:P-loop containing nucleoside triphosphate hydrolase [Artemisia annua]